jgi:hypothetical protein
VSDVLTINGSAINLASFNATLDRCTPIIKGGIPSLELSRILGALTALPDPWSGKSCALTMSGTLVFAGTFAGYVDRFMDGFGWVREYRAYGLRNDADYVPNTDAVTLTDTSVYNLPGDDPNFIGSRAGLTVGQIVQAVLTMTTNAANLSAEGVGAYVSFGPPVLPALTLSDLAALTVIPPWRASISGERLLQSLENFVQTCHPNHWMHVQPDGTIRFLDMRLAANNTLTLGSDPRLGMPTLTRDYNDCYSQVEVRGNTIAVPVMLQTQPWPGSSSSDGGLQEDFAWGSFTNAQAKLNWTPADFNQPGIGTGNSNDQGTCTVTDTTHILVTSSNNTVTWPANFWAQGANQAQGQVGVYADIIPGIGQLYWARIVANTAMTAGGTSILTLDRALPAVTYNSYQIWGLSLNSSVVWRKYKVTNAAIASAMLNFFPYAVPILTSAGNQGSLTTTPIGLVQWSNGGSAPYNTASQGITLDPVNGLIYFDRPTALVFGSQTTAPNNVMAFIPVASGSLNVIVPQVAGVPGYGGTLYTVEGVQRTKVITVRDWRDASNFSNMQTYANEVLQSLENVVVEGTVPYYGLLTTYLTVGSTGQAISIAGNGYTTGWESLSLPIVSVEIAFQSGPQGTSYAMGLHLSNRRGRFNADQFLRPNVTGAQLGGSSIFGGGAPNIAQGPTGDASNWSTALSANQGPTGDGSSFNPSLPGTAGPALGGDQGPALGGDQGTAMAPGQSFWQ